MIIRIDVSSILRRRVSELYSNLVTRPTGVAVRSEIESEVERASSNVTILDFSHVGLLDFSCADEIVAKLIMRYLADDGSRGDRYLIFYGVSETHLDAIEAVLERHQLALITQLADGVVRLVGEIEPDERRAWEAVHRVGYADGNGVALAVGISPADAERLLETLFRRRLLMRRGEGYAPVRLSS